MGKRRHAYILCVEKVPLERPKFRWKNADTVYCILKKLSLSFIFLFIKVYLAAFYQLDNSQISNDSAVVDDETDSGIIYGTVSEFDSGSHEKKLG